MTARKENGGKIAVDTPRTLPVTEIRQLIFPRETLLDAILFSERAANGWLARAPVHGVAVRAGEDVRVVVTAEREGHRDFVEVTFGAAQIAAAMIRYCRQLRIPLPRKAQKSLGVQGDNISLKTTVTLTTMPLHSRI